MGSCDPTIGPASRDPEVLVKMVAAGLGNREIGEKLFITEGTVKTHLHSVYEKLGLKGRVQLANYAQEKGLT